MRVNTHSNDIQMIFLFTYMYVQIIIKITDNVTQFDIWFLHELLYQWSSLLDSPAF